MLAVLWAIGFFLLVAVGIIIANVYDYRKLLIGEDDHVKKSLVRS